MDKSFKTEICGMGTANGNYPGEFTEPVIQIIKSIIGNSKSVLHLFSGTSTLGNIRIDIDCPQATDRKDVLEFIKNDNRKWEYIILDPPYDIKTKSKIDEYAKTSSVAADVLLRRALAEYFSTHTDNIVWLDMCAPMIRGFQRKKLWFLFPGGYRTLRILSWLKRYENRLL